jgi:hypothetical protein
VNVYQLLNLAGELQVAATGGRPEDLEGEAFAKYVRDMVLGAQVELGEFIQELPWKPWKNDAGRPDADARERAVEELIDVLHFVLNLALAMRIDGDELIGAYTLKHQVNMRRMAARDRFEERVEQTLAERGLCQTVGCCQGG